jgi:FkbM family methyltransferase
MAIQYAITPAILDAWGGIAIPPEQSLIEWAAQFLVPGKLFIDVGAHVGTWALQYGALGHKVLAFEANPATSALLHAGFVINDLLDGNDLKEVALGDRSGWCELGIISEDGGGSSILDLSTHRHPIRKKRVQIARLDDYGIENVGFMKIDVEGAESAVIRGAHQTLARSGFPRIIFESWRAYRMPEGVALRAELFAELDSLGYRIVPISFYDEMFLAERAE